MQYQVEIFYQDVFGGINRKTHQGFIATLPYKKTVCRSRWFFCITYLLLS